MIFNRLNFGLKNYLLLARYDWRKH